MSKAARTAFEEKYTDGRNYSNLMSIYERAISTRNRDSRGT
jgi:hypothetical protein